MKTVRTTGKADKAGLLHPDALSALKEQVVQGIVLIPEEAEIEEQEWLRAVSDNPAFGFLRDEKEDMYSPNDSNPFYD